MCEQQKTIGIADLAAKLDAHAMTDADWTAATSILRERFGDEFAGRLAFVAYPAIFRGLTDFERKIAEERQRADAAEARAAACVEALQYYADKANWDSSAECADGEQDATLQMYGGICRILDSNEHGYERAASAIAGIGPRSLMLQDAHAAMEKYHEYVMSPVGIKTDLANGKFLEAWMAWDKIAHPEEAKS